jgi:hypothetical protein
VWARSRWRCAGASGSGSGWTRPATNARWWRPPAGDDAYFSVTARQLDNVTAAVYDVATSPYTTWRPAAHAEADVGNEITETPFDFAGRTVRLIVRRQPRGHGAQLAFDDVDGWRFHALITNVPTTFMSAVTVELAHRLRVARRRRRSVSSRATSGCTTRPSRGSSATGCGGAALAYNVARWLRVLALSRSWHRVRGRRLRLGLLNIPARVVRSARRLHLRLLDGYPARRGVHRRARTHPRAARVRLTTTIHAMRLTPVRQPARNPPTLRPGLSRSTHNAITAAGTTTPTVINRDESRAHSHSAVLGRLVARSGSVVGPRASPISRG